jgi:hypothetical protein
MERNEIFDDNFRNKKTNRNGIDISDMDFQGKEDSYSYKEL